MHRHAVVAGWLVRHDQHIVAVNDERAGGAQRGARCAGRESLVNHQRGQHQLVAPAGTGHRIGNAAAVGIDLGCQPVQQRVPAIADRAITADVVANLDLVIDTTNADFVDRIHAQVDRESQGRDLRHIGANGRCRGGAVTQHGILHGTGGCQVQRGAVDGKGRVLHLGRHCQAQRRILAAG